MKIEKWSVGRPGTVVSNIKVQDSRINSASKPARISDEDEIEYYEGYLIAESIPTREMAELLAAAPEMRRMLNMFVNAIEGQMPDENGSYTQTFGPAMINEAKRILNLKQHE